MSRPVSTSRFERKLRAILGASGSQILDGVEDHVGGLIVLESDRPEFAAAGGEILTFSGVTQPLVAGEFPYIGVRNRPNTGVLVVVERLFYGGIAQINTFYDFTLGPADLVSVFFTRDFRNRVGAAPLTGTAQLIRGTAAASGAEAADAQLGLIIPGAAGGTPFAMDLGWILPPASGITFYGQTAGAALTLTIWCREIPLEGGVFG